MRKKWAVLINAEKKFYECSKEIRIYNKNDVQRASFTNAETDFINAEKKDSIIVTFKLEKPFRFGI